MKQFFKYMFASALGFIVAVGVLFVIFILFISILVASLDSSKKVTTEANTVLSISLNKPLTERTPNNPFKNINFDSSAPSSQPGVYDIVTCIEKAAADKNIKGIYLNTESIEGRLAGIEEIRNALLRFKKSKKFIVAYGEVYSQNAYYLASVADKVYLNPQGFLDWRGYSTTLMFLKGALEKLEIEPQIIRHGKFKSAIEPLISDRMSNENREQIKSFVDSFWEHTKKGVSESRNIGMDEIELIADSGLMINPDAAIKYGFVDKLIYQDELMAELKKLSGTKDKEVKMLALAKYNDVQAKREYSKDKVALIFASGEINSGKGDDESIGSETTAEAIRKARTDKNVKAIVFRVNSPGGSALASEVIWREISLAKKEKPVVVSMGDLAASGGYYISCAADKIVAQPNTITGSIGVFGVLFNMQPMFNNKLGITFDTYKTGDYSDTGTPFRRLTEAERIKVQQEVEHIYNVFTLRVANGRNMKQADVDSIGQGRVWGGEQALKIGLVDTLGNIQDAIAIAARLGKVEKYRIMQLPEQKDVIQEFLNELGEEAKTKVLKSELGETYPYFTAIKKVKSLQGIQARLLNETVIE